MGQIAVVFDTNVFVSAAGFGGKPDECIRAAAAEEVDVYTSEAILDEYRRVMGYDQLPFEEHEHDEILTAFEVTTAATIVEPDCSLSVVEDDPDDDKFFECAVAANADYLISGDETHVQPVDEISELSVVSPAQFLDRVDV